MTSEQIEKLVDFITSPDCKIPLAARTCLVRDYLYPRTTVSSKTVVIIVGRFGLQNFAPFALLSQLLKWLVIVYDYLEDPFILSKLYAALWTKLNYESTKQWVCHLLYLTTTAALVKPWRIQYLLEVYQKSPGNKYVIGLLRKFREYSPARVKGKLPLVQDVFQTPNQEMVDALKVIHSSQPPVDAPPKPKQETPVQAGQKRPISAISTLVRVPPPLESRYELNMGIETITSLNQFVHKYHKLKFPDQMSLVFNDTGMLSRLLLYKGDEQAWGRFDSWLVQSLFTTIDSGINGPLLEKIVSFVTYAKELPVSVEDYLYTLLTKWDGKEHRDLVLHLLSYLPMLSAETAASKLLAPLRKLIEGSDAHMHLAIFNFFLALLNHWAVLSNAGLVEDLHLSEQCRTIRIIAAFIDHYGLLALEKFPDNMSIALNILDNFDQIIAFPGHVKFPVVITPSSDLTYYFFLSRSGILLSRISGIVIASKTLHLNATRDPLVDQSTGFQSYVLDICNSVWLNKAFEDLKHGRNAINPNRFTLENEFILILREAAASVDFNLNSLLSLSSSIMFCRLAALHLREMENQRKVVTRLKAPPSYASLKSVGNEGGLTMGFNDFRVSFLDALQARGYQGLHALLYGSMRKLMEKKNAN